MTKPENYQIIDIPGTQKYSKGLCQTLSLELPTDMRYIAPILDLLQSLCNLTDPRAAQEKYLDDISTAFRESCSHLIARRRDENGLFGIRFHLFTNRIEIQIRESLEADSSDDEISSYPLHQISARVDKVDYEGRDGFNVLTIVKYFVLPTSPI